MLNSEVKVWYMTEEQRLAYIEKHPIAPTGNPKDAKFSSEAINQELAWERRKEAQKRKGYLIDKIDKDKLHSMFIAGISIKVIAATLGVSESTINMYITAQRKIDSEKWPMRNKK